MENPALTEAQKMLRMEEAQKALRPANIGSMFVKFMTEDGPITLNVHYITSFVPFGERTKVFIRGSGYYIVEHPYDEVNNLMKLSIIK